jgi:alkylhydroperoxidase family enzyme
VQAARREVPEDGVAGQGNLDGMPAGWREALRYAELVTASGHVVTDSDYGELARHWQPGEIVEITMVIGLFNYFNRFNDALRVEVTR